MKELGIGLHSFEKQRAGGEGVSIQKREVECNSLYWYILLLQIVSLEVKFENHKISKCIISIL